MNEDKTVIKDLFPNGLPQFKLSKKLQAMNSTTATAQSQVRQDPLMKLLAQYVADQCVNSFCNNLGPRSVWTKYVIHFAPERIHIGPTDAIYLRNFGISGFGNSAASFVNEFSSWFNPYFEQQMQLRAKGLNMRFTYESNRSAYGAGMLTGVCWDLSVSIQCK